MRKHLWLGFATMAVDYGDNLASPLWLLAMTMAMAMD